MRKYALLALAAIALVGTNLPASAQDQDGIKFDVIGEARFRLDYWENLTDLNDDTNDNFSAWPYRVRVGVHGMLTEKVAAHVELQNFGAFGNEFPDKFSDIEDSSGSGDDVQLYQGYLDLMDIGGSNIDARIGRQEMPYGTELLIGDGDFYNGVSFDGVHAMWMRERFDLHAFYYKVFEGNNFFDAGSNDENFLGAMFDWKFQNMGTAGAYWLSAQLLDIDSKIDTFGVRWTKMPSADSPFDWNAEYAVQTGDLFEPAFGGPAIDFSADVVEAWFGFSFGSNFRNRIRVGGLIASGDSDPLDDEEEAFFPLFSDAHQGGRLGDLDVYTATDIENINAMWTGALRDGRHVFGAAFHDFQLAENPFADSTDDLGTEFDVTYDYNPNKVVSFQIGYGQLSGADALLGSPVVAASLAPAGGGGPVITDADTITRAWAQVRARW